MNKKIIINDIVRITEPGKIYPSWLDMAKILNADINGLWKNHRYTDGNVWRNSKAKVLSIYRQRDIDHVLIQLLDYEEQYIINMLGLKKIITYTLPDELFEI